VFFRELSGLYGAYTRGEKDPLAPLPVQYADYAMWQRRWIEGEVLKGQAEYWKKNLEGIPELLEVPTDHPRPAQQDYKGGGVPVVLDEELTARVKELSARHGTTLYMTLLAAWAVLLSRLSGQQDVVIGSPTANRGQTEIENLIGFFVNTLVVRVDVSGQPTVREVLERVKTQAIAAQQHQDIPFEQVVEMAQPVRSLAHSPLFQVMFAWQSAPAGRPHLPGLEIGSLRSSPHVVSKFDMSVALHESGQRIVGGVEYATALFERETMERYVGYYRRVLEAMVRDDKQVVDRLELMSEEERREVLYGRSQNRKEIPSRCVHELFEEQAGLKPDGLAVEFEGGGLSYGELNERANQLAAELRQMGVKDEARVAICLERGLEMVVTELAVLKAGGAYVPLDAGHPGERLRYIVEDSGAGVVLTRQQLRGLFVGLSESIQVVDVDEWH
jgi:non-ribosomal peptide synthetase component F